jgi:hypothetical protein
VLKDRKAPERSETGRGCLRKAFDDGKAAAKDVLMDGLGVCPLRSHTTPPRAPKERLVGGVTSTIVAIDGSDKEINLGSGFAWMRYREGHRMVMCGLRRVLAGGCDEVGHS